MKSSSATLSATIAKLKVLAANDDWSRREGAGFALRDLMEDEFEAVMRLTKSWVRDSDERVRRAACLACMQRKGKTDIQRLPAILQRLDALMADDSLYVRKCCGPFVVGYLGYTYPRQTLPWLKKSARRRDLNVRANVAKAFTQALGRTHPREAVETLLILKEDERLRVRAAVRSAVRNIMRVTAGAKEMRAHGRELVELV